MTRLIDKDYLIEEIRCSPVGQLLIRKHNLDGMIEKFPEVDAVPVSFIQQRIDELAELAEFEFESSGGYTGKAHTQIYELRRLINYWKEERARCQPRQDRLML